MNASERIVNGLLKIQAIELDAAVTAAAVGFLKNQWSHESKADGIQMAINLVQHLDCCGDMTPVERQEHYDADWVSRSRDAKAEERMAREEREAEESDEGNEQ